MSGGRITVPSATSTEPASEHGLSLRREQLWTKGDRPNSAFLAYSGFHRERSSWTRVVRRFSNSARASSTAIVASTRPPNAPSIDTGRESFVEQGQRLRAQGVFVPTRTTASAHNAADDVPEPKLFN